MRDELVPEKEEIFGWIEQIYAQGIRRPGYPADRWAEEFCAERFRALGLEEVRLEPAPLPYWEPRSWSLHATRRRRGDRASLLSPAPLGAHRGDRAGAAALRSGIADGGEGKGIAPRDDALADPPRFARHRRKCRRGIARRSRDGREPGRPSLRCTRQLRRRAAGAALRPAIPVGDGAGHRGRRRRLHRRPHRLSRRLLPVLRALRRGGATDPGGVDPRQRRRAPPIDAGRRIRFGCGCGSTRFAGRSPATTWSASFREPTRSGS